MLLNEIAELKAAALISAGQLAAFSRRESSSARLHSINEKRLAAEGMAALAAAGKIVAEAERREADAVAAEADAVAAEAAAQLGAAAARQDAMLEAEAAREAQDAQAVSEHQSMLLARQVARAQQKSVDLEERINLMSTDVDGRRVAALLCIPTPPPPQVPRYFSGTEVSISSSRVAGER